MWNCIKMGMAVGGSSDVNGRHFHLALFRPCWSRSESLINLKAAYFLSLFNILWSPHGIKYHRGSWCGFHDCYNTPMPSEFWFVHIPSFLFSSPDSAIYTKCLNIHIKVCSIYNTEKSNYIFKTIKKAMFLPYKLQA